METQTMTKQELMAEAFASLPLDEQMELLFELGGDKLFDAMIDTMMDNLDQMVAEGQFYSVTTMEEATEALRNLPLL